MTEQNLGPLAGLDRWFVPIAPIGDDFVSGSVCLPASQPCAELTHPDGRIERLPEPFDKAAGVLIFEDHEDAIAYYQTFIQDSDGSSFTMGFASKFQIAGMSPHQVLTNFRQRTKGSMWHVPTPVYHEWAGEVIHLLATRGIGPSTKKATERLSAFMTAQN